MDVLPIRQAVVTLLRATPAITAIVPVGSTYGERVPPDRTWPFSRMGVPDTVPERAACWNGHRQNVTIHGFFKAPSNDVAAQYGATVKANLDGAILALDGGGKAELVWTGGRVLEDPDEQDGWHTVIEFEAA